MGSVAAYEEWVMLHVPSWTRDFIKSWVETDSGETLARASPSARQGENCLMWRICEG